MSLIMDNATTRPSRSQRSPSSNLPLSARHVAGFRVQESKQRRCGILSISLVLWFKLEMPLMDGKRIEAEAVLPPLLPPRSPRDPYLSSSHPVSSAPRTPAVLDVPQVVRTSCFLHVTTSTSTRSGAHLPIALFASKGDTFQVLEPMRSPAEIHPAPRQRRRRVRRIGLDWIWAYLPPTDVSCALLVGFGCCWWMGGELLWADVPSVVEGVFLQVFQFTLVSAFSSFASARTKHPSPTLLEAQQRAQYGRPAHRVGDELMEVGGWKRGKGRYEEEVAAEYVIPRHSNRHRC